MSPRLPRACGPWPRRPFPTCRCPAQAPAGSPRDVIPQLQLTKFGRETELDQVERLISGGRLVTLTGPGGVGRGSRAGGPGRQSSRARFSRWVWLVELAPLSNPSLVRTAVETVLHVQGGSATPAY